MCKMTIDRFTKWGLDFQVKYIDENFENMAEYSYHYTSKIEPELPAILIDGKLYGRKDAYNIIKESRRNQN